MENKIIILLVNFVLRMLRETKYTKLEHALEDLKTALPYIDYFKRDEFFAEYLKEEDSEDA